MSGDLRKLLSLCLHRPSSLISTSTTDKLNLPRTAYLLRLTLYTPPPSVAVDLNKGLDPVCWNTIVGDIAHNFADGMTMGAAFLGCSLAVGWTVTAANLMHEIPHEFVDFMVLVNGGMSVTQVPANAAKLDIKYELTPLAQVTSRKTSGFVLENPKAAKLPGGIVNSILQKIMV